MHILHARSVLAVCCLHSSSMRELNDGPLLDFKSCLLVLKITRKAYSSFTSRLLLLKKYKENLLSLFRDSHLLKVTFHIPFLDRLSLIEVDHNSPSELLQSYQSTISMGKSRGQKFSKGKLSK